MFPVPGRVRLLLLPPAVSDVSTEYVGVIGLALTLSREPMSQTLIAGPAVSPARPIPCTSPVTGSKLPARLSTKTLSISVGLL